MIQTCTLKRAEALIWRGWPPPVSPFRVPAQNRLKTARFGEQLGPGLGDPAGGRSANVASSCVGRSNPQNEDLKTSEALAKEQGKGGGLGGALGVAGGSPVF